MTACREETITAVDLPFYLHQSRSGASPTEHCSLLRDVVARAEKNAILEALKTTDYNKAQAAAILGIHRTLLYKKMQKYGLSLTGGS